MRHARKDYDRIQDLAEVCQWLSESFSQDDVREVERTGPERIIRLLEARYQFDRTVMPIPIDEPVFLLRGQDKIASSTVAFWAGEALSAGADGVTCSKAVDWAETMAMWPIKKTPDMSGDH